MWIYNLSYGFGRKQDTKKLHKLTFCSVFFWFVYLGGKLLRFWCFCRHFRLEIVKGTVFYKMAAFPILLAADAMGDASVYGASNQKDWTSGWSLVASGLRHPSERTQTTICALLTTICISWVPGLILDFSGGYVRFGYKRVCVWMQYYKKYQKIKQTHMCLVTRSNVRVCVWYLTTTNACMFDPKRFPNANVCGMCAERVFLCLVCRQEESLRVCIRFTVTNALCLYANIH